MAPKKIEEPERKPLIGRVGTNLKVGIVGIPNVGKSTFFNVLTKSQAAAENFPFCTIDPNENKYPHFCLLPIFIPFCKFVLFNEQVFVHFFSVRIIYANVQTLALINIIVRLMQTKFRFFNAQIPPTKFCLANCQPYYC